ncbi:hypothetical protein BJV82DRAFT_503280, partial [Fennellomyces sp. T-0311]
TFRVNGTMYHAVGPLRAPEPAPARFAQIYFADTNEQLARRGTLFSGLNAETIEMIQGVIDRCNPFARQFSSAYQRFHDQPIGTLQIVITQAAELGRRYKQQVYPEVAAMVVENSVDGAVEPFSIVINDRTEGLRLVSSLHASYMPLHYVLMFSFGEYGWHLP